MTHCPIVSMGRTMGNVSQHSWSASFDDIFFSLIDLLIISFLAGWRTRRIELNSISFCYVQTSPLEKF